MFKVNNKDTRTTSMTPFSIVTIVDFEHLFVCCENICTIGKTLFKVNNEDS